MQTKTLMSATAAIAVVGTAATLPMMMASASPRGATRSAAASAAHTTRMTFKAHQGSDIQIDVGTKGYGAGDDELGTATLTSAGHPVGRMNVSCLTVRVGNSTADEICTFTLALHDGQLIGNGAVRDGRQGPGTFTLPITGGTGRYRTARGVLKVTATNGSTVPLTATLVH